MKKLLRILSLILLFSISLSMLISCSEDREHKVGSLSITVPEKLRVTRAEGFGLYLSTMECALTVEEMTDEALADAGLTKADGLEAMVNAYFEKNKIDKEQCDLTYSEKQNAYKFRYSVSRDNEIFYFHYIVMIGNSESFYFVDMFCDFDRAGDFLPDFTAWGNTVKVE